jgi:Nickel responsive protein SCO4226-like
MVSEEAPPVVTEYLAECLWPGVTQAEMDEVDARARSTTERASGAQRDVRYLGSILMPRDEVVFFVFSGPSAKAVHAVATRAEIPFERIVPSIRRPNPHEREEQ